MARTAMAVAVALVLTSTPAGASIHSTQKSTIV